VSRKPNSFKFIKLNKLIFDLINKIYNKGKFNATKDGNTIIINKSNGLIGEINNMFLNYNTFGANYTESDILVILLYGVEGINQDVRFKLELPKPKLKIVRVGESNTEKFKKVLDCKQDQNSNGCGLYSDLTSLYQMLNNDNNLIKSVILWFDTHHDFKGGKNGRYTKAENVWNDKFGGTFIRWYVDKFFKPIFNPNNIVQEYSFSDYAVTLAGTIQPTQEKIILGPVIRFSNNTTAIPTLLYKISIIYLQNNDFEKKMLLHYIVHNFDVTSTPQGAPRGNNDSTTLLRDILYVHKDTYDKLKENIQNIINNNNNQKIKAGAKAKLKKLEYFFKGFDFSTIPNFTSNHTKYVNDAGKSSYPLRDDNVQYVPAALFDANKSNTYEPTDNSNTDYDDITGNNKPLMQYNTGINNLGKNYKYIRTNCRLEITPSTANQNNNALEKADIRCSSTMPLDFPEDETETINYAKLKKYLMTNHNISDTIFIDKMSDVLLRFVGAGNKFAVKTEGKNKRLIFTLPKYFNSIKTGPSVQDLVFLTILYRLNSINTVRNPTGDISLELIDNIVNLKRLGDYGQVIDAKMANLPFFTIDSMESLMCIIEKVSCYIDFNQGLIIYDNGGNNGGFIRSKNKTLNGDEPPGYGRREIDDEEMQEE
jgi:hypothetical protein